MIRRLPIAIAAFALIAVLAIVFGFSMPEADAAHQRWVTPSTQAAQANPSNPSPEPTSTLASASLPAFKGEFLGWAMLDRKTGTVTGQNLDKTSSTESMVKTWLVADHLRRSAQRKGPTKDELKMAGEAIKWSDDNAAQELYEANGGDASIERMISICGLTGTSVHEGWWSKTEMSPRDAVQLGDCLMNGTAAGSSWTPWLLTQMREVAGSTSPTEQFHTRGGGRWGIIDGVPADQATGVAIKNGWTARPDGNWHVNCLAVTDSWSMAVMMRYPSSLGLDYGAQTCESVARQLLA